MKRSFAFIRGLFFVLLAFPARAAVEGVVFNGTTAREQADVVVTLVRLEQGMVPMGTARSDAYGKFHFAQSPPPGQPMLLRAEFEGVTYNQMIPPGSRTADVKVTVYRAAPIADHAPEQHFLLLEPSGQEMIIKEFFLFRNQATPPVTWADAKRGTLRFYLPKAAKGVVQASATGPGGMPIRVSAEASDQAEVDKVNFPIKPGESRIELTYLVPYQSPMQYDIRGLYDGLLTRVAVPRDVKLAGEGLEAVPDNPQIQASIFTLPSGRSAPVTISGEGRISVSGNQQQTSDEGGDKISVIPAAINNQLWIVLGFTLTILAAGFLALYHASPAATAEKPAQPKGRRKA
jgi:hypothetical protein